MKVLIFKKKLQGVVDNSYIEFGKGIVNPDKGKHDCSEKEYDKHGPLRFVAAFSNTPIEFAYYLYTPPEEEIDINSLPSFEFSTDEGKNWNDYQATKKTDNYYVAYIYPKIIVKKGESVLFRGINETFRLSYQSSLGTTYANLRINPLAFVYVYGDITSLLNNVGGSIPVPEYCFSGMFDHARIITPPSLPSKQLAEYCYSGMFQGCSSLVEAPELPAEQLAEYCYSSMFQGCSSLVEAPELPAEQLAEYCYNFMFDQCSSLVETPELPATQLAEGCYTQMFSMCTSLAEAPELLPATQLAEGCYSRMFYQCTSLVEAPELPATQLVSGCYSSMFSGCTSLNKVTALFTTKPIGYYDDEEGMYYFSYTNGWLYGVAQNGTFVKNASATWDDDEGMMSYNNGGDSIPVNWTVETK